MDAAQDRAADAFLESMLIDQATHNGRRLDSLKCRPGLTPGPLMRFGWAEAQDRAADALRPGRSAFALAANEAASASVPSKAKSRSCPTLLDPKQLPCAVGIVWIGQFRVVLRVDGARSSPAVPVRCGRGWTRPGADVGAATPSRSRRVQRSKQHSRPLVRLGAGSVPCDSVRFRGTKRT